MKRLIIFLPLLITLNTLQGIPANPSPILFTQPDGTIFIGFVRGDEWCNWKEQQDGYTISKDSNGLWVFVQGKDANDNFILTDIPAHENPSGITIEKKHIVPRRLSVNPEHEKYAINYASADRDRFQIPLLLIEYPNMNHSYPMADFDSLMNQIGYVGPHGPTGSFREYYLENSYGAFDPEATVSGWYMADSNYQIYGYANGWEMVRELIANAVDDAEEAGMDWSFFDNDGDGNVDALNIVHAGGGAEEGNGSYIWSHKWNLGDHARFYDGVIIDSYTINPEKQGGMNATMVNFGVICHEFGHALGLPDLYDIDYSSSGIGTWGLMSGGSWGGNGSSAWYPSHMCAWSKMNVSVGPWLTPLNTTESIETIDLPNVEMNPVAYMMGDSLQYFLFENRQKIGFDQTLKQSGLLIWHIDDAVSCEGNGCNSDEWHRRVDLEQADGLFHLNHGTNNGDMSDPYPGNSNNMEFGFTTNPNSQYYSGEASGVHVHDIEENGELVVLTFRNLPSLSLENFTYSELTGDGDNIPNPGETVEATATLYNPSEYSISNLSATVTAVDPNLTILTESITLSDVDPFGLTDNTNSALTVEFAENAPLGSYELELNIVGIMNGDSFEQSLSIAVSLSINQQGFPYTTDSRIKSSPAVVDIDGGGDLEIVFGSYDGYLHVLNHNGSPVSGNWPFDAGDQIWASPAVADLDGDGAMEIVIVSKSKHLFILSPNGEVLLDINTGQFLIGTPAIGNLDDDPDLEIVFGSVAATDDPTLYALNLDGTAVEGFPITIGEKVYAGVALADFDGNERDDIVCATDDNNIYLIYDDGTMAEGFPFVAESGFRSAPSVMDVDGEKFIFAGSRDHRFYMLNSDGSLRFQIQTGNDVISSPAFVNLENRVGIFFTSTDGYLYGIDQYSGTLPGWPIDLGSTTGLSPVIADLDNDSSPEVIVATEEGTLCAYSIGGLTVFPFPIIQQNITGVPVIRDVDLDGDLEIFCGQYTELLGVDVKTTGSVENYWDIYRGNLSRTGLFIANSVPMANDPLSILPSTFSMNPVYPNPFNPVTTISFSIPVVETRLIASLHVYDITGRLVETLVNGITEPGNHTVKWDASDFSSGVYFARLKAKDFVKTQKLILLK